MTASATARRLVKPVVTVAMFAFMIAGVRRLLGTFDYRAVVAGLDAIPIGSIALALGLLIAQHGLYVVREALAARFAGHGALGLGRIVVASLVARSLSTLGLATITGLALRLRIYEAWGLTRRDVATLSLYNESTYYVGVVASLAVIGLATDLPGLVAVGRDLPSPRLIGAAAAALVAAYVALSLRRRTPWRIRTFELPVVRGELLAGQLILPLLDLFLAAAIVWVCLPASAGLGLVETAGVCLVGGLIGSASQVPGGLGVFETVVLQFVPPGAHPAALAGLLVRRVVVNLVPLALGTVVLVGFELGRRPAPTAVPGWRRDAAATAMAMTTFASGVLLMVAASVRAAGPFAALGSVGHAIVFADGFATLWVARGLHLRRARAWAIALALFGARAGIAMIAGPDWLALGLSLAVLALLLGCRRALCDRPLARDDDQSWAAAFVVAMAGVGWIALVADPDPMTRAAVARGAGVILVLAVVAALAVTRWRRA